MKSLAPAKQKALTAKQQRFVTEYLIDLNATQAAIRAGYSKKTAQRIGFENLTKPVVKAAIATAFADRQERTKIKGDHVLQIICDEVERCRADPGHAAADVYRGCELLGKHLCLFVNRHQIDNHATVDITTDSKRLLAEVKEAHRALQEERH